MSENILNAILCDIDNDDDFNLDDFVMNRSDRLAAMYAAYPGVEIPSMFYRRGLLDGAMLMSLYGQARGGRR